MKLLRERSGAGSKGCQTFQKRRCRFCLYRTLNGSKFLIMLKYLFLFIVTVHGVIHLMAFAKAFKYAEINQLTQPISKNTGLFWLFATLLFLATTALFLSKIDYWWIVATLAVLVSQFLIFNNWQDAKAGTIANIIILAGIIAGYGSQRFENSFKKDVWVGLNRTNNLEKAVLTEGDIQTLPPVVQKYIHYVGALGKPKINNFRVVFEGEMRDKGKDWFPFRSEQYNFLDSPTRLFFMKGQMFGMTVPGYHAYKEATATMQIKIFGLYPVVDIKGKALNQAETVTLFNDMCLLAPAALIDQRIQWQPVDNLSVKAIFTNKGITIAANLYFNEQGQLINFTSDDRTSINDMQQYRFSTPVKNYVNMNGRNVISYGETVWHYPDGAFTYGKFNLKEIEYNTRKTKNNP